MYSIGRRYQTPTMYSVQCFVTYVYMYAPQGSSHSSKCFVSSLHSYQTVGPLLIELLLLQLQGLYKCQRGTRDMNMTRGTRDMNMTRGTRDMNMTCMYVCIYKSMC